MDIFNTIFKTRRRYIIREPFRHSLNSDPDTHIIMNNWIIKMLLSKYTEVMAFKKGKWELITLPEHLRPPPVFGGVRLTRCLVLWVMFCKSLFAYLSFFFGHSVVCSSSIYGFWLPLWYLQALRTLDLGYMNTWLGIYVLNLEYTHLIWCIHTWFGVYVPLIWVTFVVCTLDIVQLLWNM